MRTPYVLTCAATLEYLLNDLIAAHTLHNYNIELADSIADSLYRLPFLNKLITIPTLATHGRLRVNRNSDTYGALKRLIRVRNTLVHNKTNAADLDCEMTEDGSLHFRLPMRVLENHPQSIQVKDCEKYREALLDFVSFCHAGRARDTFSPDSIKPSKFLI